MTTADKSVRKKYCGIYVHIPFCVKKCNYCAFLSFPCNTLSNVVDDGKLYKDYYVEKYIKYICKEIEIWSEKNADSITDCIIDSIYFGGGTPSLLPVQDMSYILRKIHSTFNVSDNSEITIEANPATLGKTNDEIRKKLQAYKMMGINRLSMGVQSIDNNRLKLLGRIHSCEDVKNDFHIAREVGFENINLDLIFSVPGETESDALSDAEALINLNPEHISCYSLQLEEGTPFYDMAEKGKIKEVSDEEDRNTYHSICRLLEKYGYEHYEISNFGKIRSRHNSKYWSMAPYIGFGLGASGFFEGSRTKNYSNFDLYFREIDKDNLPVEESTINRTKDNISEAVFTGLRRLEGITYKEIIERTSELQNQDLLYDKEIVNKNETQNDIRIKDIYENCTRKKDDKNRYKEAFWQIYKDVIDDANSFVKTGHLIIDDNGMKLTKKGLDICNSIMALFV